MAALVFSSNDGYSDWVHVDHLKGIQDTQQHPETILNRRSSLIKKSDPRMSERG